MVKNSINLLIVTATLLLSGSATAQIMLGAKAGANLYDNYQSGSKYYVSKPHTGFHVGVYGDYLISSEMSVRAEALFSTRGSYLSEYVNGERIDYEQQASYIDIPVSLSYRVMPAVSVHAGVLSSLFVDEFRSITKNSGGFGLPDNDQLKSYERWQFGALAGASYNFTLMDHGLEAGARMSVALTNTHEPVRQARASRDPKFMMIQLYLAYNIFTF
ncbi:outer membrane beta-barrel protein [Fulvivirgaceae bacterium PWU4]|uniref:Outer membrane beta-barrel protein n=2 Tax=Chryseosolibacter histidini TaxID=2782349 RepID=A0AAP2DMR5_9BACT|nr:porin family protein [Chryseosolibacter histidini]MBT1697967.1 outer membrane beta-barrel protein [Chryseosolibacter histidini]